MMMMFHSIARVDRGETPWIHSRDRSIERVERVVGVARVGARDDARGGCAISRRRIHRRGIF